MLFKVSHTKVKHRYMIRRLLVTLPPDGNVWVIIVMIIKILCFTQGSKFKSTNYFRKTLGFIKKIYKTSYINK